MRQVIVISHVKNNKTKTIQEQSSQGEKADDKKKDLKTHWAGGEEKLPYIIKDGCDKRWRGGRRLDKHGILVPILSHCLKLFCLGFDHIKVLSFRPFCQLFIMIKYFLFRVFRHSVLLVTFFLLFFKDFFVQVLIMLFFALVFVFNMQSYGIRLFTRLVEMRRLWCLKWTLFLAIL